MPAVGLRRCGAANAARVAFLRLSLLNDGFYGLTDGSCPAAAVRNINITNRSVCMEVVGYLLEELRDADNFRSFKKDIAAANIFIGSLIFIEELAEKVRATELSRCSACLGLWSIVGTPAVTGRLGSICAALVMDSI